MEKPTMPEEVEIIKWISTQKTLPTVTTNQFSHETDVLIRVVLNGEIFCAVDRLLEVEGELKFRTELFSNGIVTHWQKLPKI